MIAMASMEFEITIAIRHSQSILPVRQSISKPQKMEPSRKRTRDVDIIKQLIRWVDGVPYCAAEPESGCDYAPPNFDSGNYGRHIRRLHPAAALRHNLAKKEPTKKKKDAPKIPVGISKAAFVEGCLKLVTLHHLPLACFEWEGMKLLLDPVAKALDITVNRKNIKVHLKHAAQRVKEAIVREMSGKLISVKLDSASKHHRHILGINVQYEIEEQVVIRTLAMVEVKHSQTATFLKNKILEVLEEYGVTIEQIFSVTVDNGANMLAAVRKLKTDLSHLLLENDDTVNVMPNEDAEETHDYEEEADQLIEELILEFSNQISLVRCAVHTLQLAVGDIVKKNDLNIARITKMVKESRKTLYALYFEHNKVAMAPLWCITRWGGRFVMINSIASNQNFYQELAHEHKELALLENDWKYMKNFVNAFKPVYELTKRMQEKQCSLNDFYISWLQTTCKVEKEADSPFSAPLVDALNTRLIQLMANMAFKAALFLDPRLNFLGSKVFASAQEKQDVMQFIENTYNRIVKLSGSASGGPSTSSTLSQQTAEQSSEDANDELDEYLTRKLGGSSSNPAGPSSFHAQLRQLELEPRQPHSYDVWKHWIARKNSHPELYAVAMVVLATPSNQVSVERAFSALGLVLSDLRTGLAEKTLEEILLIKLNREVFQELIPTLYNWRDTIPV